MIAYNNNMSVNLMFSMFYRQLKKKVKVIVKAKAIIVHKNNT